MKAYIVEQPGGPEGLKLRDIPSPKAGADEVKIRVRAFGLNRIRTYFRAGKMGAITAPRVPGIEAVGEVINDPTNTFSIGQRVATVVGGMQFDRPGSYAEEVCVLRNNVIDLEGTTLESGRIPSLHVRTFDFDDVPAAHSFMESNGAIGKLVVRL
jgi:NADPH2:quinone reductase